MKNKVIYIHGQGGNSSEANHYKEIFHEYDVIGLEYLSNTPWESREEFPKIYNQICEGASSVIIIANSIGAYFAMSSLFDKKIDKAFFISPIVDMEKLIQNMMNFANVTEKELKEKGEIITNFGQVLSWEYLFYVKNNKINWNVPTHILYGENDNMTSLDLISKFASETKSSLTIMPNGEHWFHTDKQMIFLDEWIISHI